MYSGDNALLCIILSDFLCVKGIEMSHNRLVGNFVYWILGKHPRFALGCILSW